jgi:acetyl-CoA C-acetyltransferase
VNFHESAAIAKMGERARAMAGVSMEEIDLIDLYSCFPCAVEIARDALGIAEDDPRDLTVTGGLPFHGGAGSNYSMNAIATLMDRLRAGPAKRGLVTANGGYLSKHAAGIYATEPADWPWVREDPTIYQSDLDALTGPTLVERPEGAGWIETYTVGFGRSGEPERGIIVGRMGEPSDPTAPRFLANTPADADLLLAMTKEDFLGCAGYVSAGDAGNLFVPAIQG